MQRGERVASEVNLELNTVVWSVYARCEASGASTHAALSLGPASPSEAAQHAVEYQQRDRETFSLFPSLPREGGSSAF